MPDRRGSRPYRAKGSSVPRLAGMSVVLVLAVGGLAAYLASTHPHQAAAPRRHKQTALASRVLKVQSVGIIDFGPDDDGDDFRYRPDDHALMLQPEAGVISFVAIPAAELSSGEPNWTDDQMADGSHIFIYAATGQCLSAGRNPAVLRLARCNLSIAQRWRPIDASAAQGQAFAKYANAETGRCLSAPRTEPGPARLTRCGPPQMKNQEIAFWWIA